jgi:predicted small metal-binding protein
MAKVLRCRDLGVDCDFVASGKTKEEVLKKAAEHDRKDQHQEGHERLHQELAETHSQ